MQASKTLRRHAALFDRMSTHVGIDLEEEVMRGHLEPSEVTDGVLRCTGCTRPDDCESWLASGTHKGEPEPNYCRNHELLKRLKP